MSRDRSSRPTMPCSNPDCENVVLPRRPSETGDHWCSAKPCQAMKQRQRRAAKRLAERASMTVEQERMALVAAALHRPRRRCEDCGLEDAVDGFLHRAAAGATSICVGTGGAGRAAGAAWIDLIHPELAKR